MSCAYSYPYRCRAQPFLESVSLHPCKVEVQWLILVILIQQINTIIEFIPTYFDIIPKGNERDLGEIKRNLERDVYTSIEQLEADVELMLENCFTFNAPDNQVYKSGEEVQRIFQAGIAKIKAEGGTKKRSGDKAGGVSKKIKF